MAEVILLKPFNHKKEKKPSSTESKLINLENLGLKHIIIFYRKTKTVREVDASQTSLIMGSNPTQVKTMIHHVTPVQVGSRKQKLENDINKL